MYSIRVKKIRMEMTIMKDITFVVPCYNSQDYMKRCIDSLLFCKERGEIIIVDDGATDATGEIAD